MSAQELCAVAAYKWIAGVLRMDCWIKNKPAVEALVRDLGAARWEEVRIDTLRDGVFVVIENGMEKHEHAREFLEWCKR